MTDHKSKLASILRRHESRILADWVADLAKVVSSGSIDKAELDEQAKTFARLLTEAMQTSSGEDITGQAWAPVREMLTTISTSRARQGFTPTDTATFIFSMKQPLFTALRD